MIELDEIAELAWLPFALLAALAAWRWRPTLLAGLGGKACLSAWRVDAPFAPGRWLSVAARSVPGWAVRLWRSGAPSSGNQSFDAYRDDALRRLGEEQREFQEHLQRLRQARDRAEFDAYMAERAR